MTAPPSKPWTRPENWIIGLVVLVVLIVVFVQGLEAYMRATATPLHPSSADAPSVTRSTPPPKWTAAVDEARRVARASLAEVNLPGLSVAVGQGSEVVWAEGFGFADLDSKEPVAPDTRFRIGTASTVLTSAALGLLHEAGRLDLDAEIQTYVPEYPKQRWPVTVRQLMAHTAGVRNDGGDEGPIYSKQCLKPTEAIEFFEDAPLRFEPGTDFRFSSFGWILLSAAVETASNEPFLIHVHKRVFEPLGMTDTIADTKTTEPPPPRRATPYFPRYGGDPRYGPDPMRPVEYSCYSGASVFLSTPSDLVRFGLAINAFRLLKPDTVKLFQTSQRLPEGETGYGLGWHVETVTLAGKQARSVGHVGNVLGGPAASLMTFPDLGLSVAVVSNTSYAEPEAIALKIGEVFARVK